MFHDYGGISSDFWQFELAAGETESLISHLGYAANVVNVQVAYIQYIDVFNLQPEFIHVLKQWRRVGALLIITDIHQDHRLVRADDV